MMRTDGASVLFCGCGFLASHILPHILPHASHIALLDRERVEKVNYDNAILPKNYAGRRKVTALASLVQILSSTRTTPVHEDIRETAQLARICEEHAVDFMFVTFDNIPARLIAKRCALELEVPALFAGVTERFAYIDWAESVNIPESAEAIALVDAENKRIRDVCTRLEFRPLGAVCAGYAYHAFARWLASGEKRMYQISVAETIASTSLRRG